MSSFRIGVTDDDVDEIDGTHKGTALTVLICAVFGREFAVFWLLEEESEGLKKDDDRKRAIDVEPSGV